MGLSGRSVEFSPEEGLGLLPPSHCRFQITFVFILAFGRPSSLPEVDFHQSYIGHLKGLQIPIEDRRVKPGRLDG